MRDFLDLIGNIPAPFVFFSHEDSGIIDFIEWMKATKAKNHEALQNIEVVSKMTTANWSTRYTDFMVVAK